MHLTQGPTQLITEPQLEPMSPVPTVCLEFTNIPKVMRSATKWHMKEKLFQFTQKVFEEKDSC